MSWHDDLAALGPCRSALDWSRAYPTLEDAWQACERGDWMLWLAARLDTSAPWSDERKPIVRAANACARLALQYTIDTRVADCVETLDRWYVGRATRDEVRAAYYAAAYAAYAAATRAAHAATYAAYAASFTANTADVAVAVADAAADVAVAVADAAANAANAACDAHDACLRECADIVRRYLPVPVLGVRS